MKKYFLLGIIGVIAIVSFTLNVINDSHDITISDVLNNAQAQTEVEDCRQANCMPSVIYCMVSCDGYAVGFPWAMNLPWL